MVNNKILPAVKVCYAPVMLVPSRILHPAQIDQATINSTHVMKIILEPKKQVNTSVRRLIHLQRHLKPRVIMLPP